ncbi:MAG: hypothetical protein J7483_10455 [Novosphingobium sp.]|nr:hypothetical protein [Novosphingobium sp.]
MITAREIRGARFAVRLAEKARALAAARAEARLRERRGDARRWRLARLLWPNFKER